jgi:hypothetical protein
VAVAQGGIWREGLGAYRLRRGVLATELSEQVRSNVLHLVRLRAQQREVRRRGSADRVGRLGQKRRIRKS